MRTTTIAAALAAALALTACGSDDDGPQTLTGSFTLRADNLTGSWDSCRGDGGYSDFGSGMNVTIRSGAGEVIGSGNTRNLTATDSEGVDLEAEDPDISLVGLTATLAEIMDGSRCTVWFETEIGEADFYLIEIGRRGELTYTAAELEDRDWHVELTLGD